MNYLRMYRMPGTPLDEDPLPEGYSISHYQGEADIPGWINCCKDSLDDNFQKEIIGNPDVVPERDVLFLDHEGQHVGTATIYPEPDGRAHLHMFALRSDYRRKGLARFLLAAALKKARAEGGDPLVLLLTEDHRLPAIQLYLDMGFCPVDYTYGIRLRWEQVLENLRYDHVRSYNDDATPYKLLYRASKAAKIKPPHLLMYWLPGMPIDDPPLPEGYTVSQYKSEADIPDWKACCEDALRADFRARLLDDPDVDVYRDVFFLDYNGQHVGTISAYMQPLKGMARIHMVGVKPAYRGRGLSRYLMAIALKKLTAEGVPLVHLTTDEDRPAALKGYLSAGFLPVEYDYGAQERWEQVLETYNIDHIQMLYEDATPYKVIYRASKATKIKIGVLGAGRGKAMMRYCVESGNAELVAVCDRYQPRLDEVRNTYGKGRDITYYTEFEDFLKHDMDLVVLANFATAHTPFAIRCMEAGKNVLSELLPVQTMKEAVERTGKRYFYAEDFCYFPITREMTRRYRAGELGEFLYGEGEYLHRATPEAWNRLTFANPDHWRNRMHAFFYCTHSLGPILHATGLRPKTVVGVEGPVTERTRSFGKKGPAFGVEMVTMENGGVLKSLHGIGVTRKSYFFSLMGSKGRLESARADTSDGYVGTVYENLDPEIGTADPTPHRTAPQDGLSKQSDGFGHFGADYYMMYNIVMALRGNRRADTVDVYEALDMALPGLFAYRSVLNGGAPVAIPDLRDPAQREQWRNDVACCDPAVAGDQLWPSYSGGDPEIPPEVYQILSEHDWDKGKKFV